MSTIKDIDKLIDAACVLFRKAVAADAPEGDRAMDLYVEQRRLIREAIQKHRRLTDYLEQSDD